MELEECPGCGDDESDAAEHGGDYPGSSLTRSLEKTLHRARAVASNELIELADDFPADGFGTENHARDRGGDQQHWSDREERVVRERRAEARSIVIPPGSECRPEYRHDHRRTHDSRPPGPTDQSLEQRVCATWSNEAVQV